MSLTHIIVIYLILLGMTAIIIVITVVPKLILWKPKSTLEKQETENGMAHNPLFDDYALTFPDINSITDENILEKIRQLLENPKLTETQHTKYADIIQELIAKLESEIAEEDNFKDDE